MPAAAAPMPFNLWSWIKKNKHNLKPPVSNKQLCTEANDAIIFVSGGPNTRNDFHVNPTEELFYQLKGDIAVRIRPLDGSKPRDVVIREGEMYLLPRWLPHRPQRPANTVGLIVEFPRPKGELDALRWYCPECDELVYEAKWRLKKIDEDLRILMHDFWDGPEKRRTCRNCGHIVQRAGAIKIMRSKVTPAKAVSPKKHDLRDKQPGREAQPRPASRNDPSARTPARGAKGRGQPRASSKKK
ncbi:MAG TPA: 3-hydroxyanthranilate 3,4-dioxygenase [Phycisphaerales bacterium]|nr:3-hydroxyanthranilate 3,4-dioxygenase [Phycisphaerales bacterium]